jgi:tetratricopeptide (TPR) repeat protein
LKRRGRAGLIGFGLLYVWILFLVEFTAARFQEPFVLYRSYLWAPGILLAFGALLSRVPSRAALVAFAIAGPVLLYQAHDRLVTFSSPFLLWKDALAKLPDKPVPWGSRTLYNVGGEYMRAGHPNRAIEIVERCMAQYPDTYHCYTARGAIHLELEEFEQALPYLARAVLLNPTSAIAYHRLGRAMEKLDRIQEAKALYRRASQLGFRGADLEIKRLEAAGGGFMLPNSEPLAAWFGTYRLYNGAYWYRHTGVDIRVPVGTSVAAPASGRVMLAQQLPIRGNYILIDHGWGVYSGLAHLSEMFVIPGQWVRQGDIIGLSGMTGRTSGAHIHWEVALDETWVDPENLMSLGLDVASGS